MAPPLRKVIHPVGIAFKGSGFYKTDSERSVGQGLGWPRREGCGCGGRRSRTSPRVGWVLVVGSLLWLGRVTGGASGSSGLRPRRPPPRAPRPPPPRACQSPADRPKPHGDSVVPMPSNAARRARAAALGCRHDLTEHEFSAVRRHPPRSASSAAPGSTTSSTTTRPSRSTPRSASPATRSSSVRSRGVGSRSSPVTARATASPRTGSTTAPTSGRCEPSGSARSYRRARSARSGRSTVRARSSSRTR